MWARGRSPLLSLCPLKDSSAHPTRPVFRYLIVGLLILAGGHDLRWSLVDIPTSLCSISIQLYMLA